MEILIGDFAGILRPQKSSIVSGFFTGFFFGISKISHPKANSGVRVKNSFHALTVNHQFFLNEFFS